MILKLTKVIIWIPPPPIFIYISVNIIGNASLDFPLSSSWFEFNQLLLPWRNFKGNWILSRFTFNFKALHCKLDFLVQSIFLWLIIIQIGYASSVLISILTDSDRFTCISIRSICFLSLIFAQNYQLLITMNHLRVWALRHFIALRVTFYYYNLICLRSDFDLI